MEYFTGITLTIIAIFIISIIVILFLKKRYNNRTIKDDTDSPPEDIYPLY